jgi:hypothetical protein
LKAAPSDPVLWNDLGLLWKGAGRLADAVEAFAQSRRSEPAPKSGPATTNLALLALRGVAVPLADPVQALGVVLAEHPDAALARRACLDLVVARAARRGAFAAAAPDMPMPPR